jgi:hypothetical protein
MKLQIELEPMVLNLLMDIGKLEGRDPEQVLQTEINGYVHDRLMEEGNNCDPEESQVWFDKAAKLFNSW